MKLFVAYAFAPRDRWIPEMVFPILDAIGVQVDTGEVAHGAPLSSVVREKIKQADGLLAFATRREALENGQWTTHRLVVEELAHAHALGLQLLEVRETEVEDQGGF